MSAKENANHCVMRIFWRGRKNIRPVGLRKQKCQPNIIKQSLEDTRKSDQHSSCHIAVSLAAQHVIQPCSRFNEIFAAFLSGSLWLWSLSSFFQKKCFHYPFIVNGNFSTMAKFKTFLAIFCRFFELQVSAQVDLCAVSKYAQQWLDVNSTYGYSQTHTCSTSIYIYW